jgi:hypothetical protein
VVEIIHYVVCSINNRLFSTNSFWMVTNKILQLSYTWSYFIIQTNVCSHSLIDSYSLIFSHPHSYILTLVLSICFFFIFLTFLIAFSMIVVHLFVIIIDRLLALYFNASVLFQISLKSKGIFLAILAIFDLFFYLLLTSPHKRAFVANFILWTAALLRQNTYVRSAWVNT